MSERPWDEKSRDSPHTVRKSRIRTIRSLRLWPALVVALEITRTLCMSAVVRPIPSSYLYNQFNIKGTTVLVSFLGPSHTSPGYKNCLL
ncbi:hypothetical protein XELAEV_18037136mg [Xenopus laevis]|uniref:Uncharacterized protein n=1 Tax=Xenopus laevis TaxID=8355 RepID=A0A974CCU1_XENLA|nr:hypothetical protein XELAEV_18037136mg [Xenopus laevis]